MSLSYENFTDFTDKQLECIEFYCKNDLKELKKLCNPMLKLKNIPSMSHEDLYDVAIECLCSSVKKYDDEKSQFKTFLLGNIKKRFFTWMRNSARSCRCNVERDENGRIIVDEETGNNKVIYNASIYSETEDGCMLGDTIKSDYNLEDQVLNKQEYMSEKTKMYINSLGSIQKQIAYYLMDGYESEEIKELLSLTDKEYSSFLSDMKSYDKKKNLVRDFNANNNNEEILKESSEMSTLTSEKTKNTSYSLASISKKLRNYQIRDNHVLQRASGQWNGKTKSELISDILQGKALTQIIISEEIKNNIQMLWLIDGKQRCTNIDDYLHDGFSISKNVKVQEIPYQTQKLDENGNVMLNEDGFPIPEVKSFNIVGKKFSQLPEELQDKFKDYQLPVMLNLNCNKRDIAYDISRFNRCRPMNKAQNGWTGFDEDYAELVDNILKMDFFKADCPKSNYTSSNEKNGALRRMIVETVMVSEYFDNYQTDFVKMCEFLTENANENMFIDIYEDIDQLTEVLTEETSDLFNTKNTFVLFALYKKFKKVGLSEVDYNNFMVEFKNDLHSATVGEYCFDDLDAMRNTKDKTVIKRKLCLLEKLMLDYFDIENIEIEDAQTKEDGDSNDIVVDSEEETITSNTIEFLKQNVNSNIEEDDIEFYEESLDDYLVEIPQDSKILEPANTKSMIAICAYSYDVDEDLGEWLVDYVKRNDSYVLDQKQNFLHMKDDFDKFFGINSKENIA